MNKKIINILFSVLEYSIGAIVLFIQYRLMIKVLGLSSLGLWSLILTFISLTSVGTSGFSGSVVRYIAIYKARTNTKVDKLIETIEISVAIISLVLIIMLMILMYYFGLYFFTTVELNILNEIIPIIIIGFFISTLSGVHLQALDGLQLIYLRNIINIISKFSYLILIYSLINKYGIMGISIAFLISSLITISLSTFFIKKYVPSKKIILLRFDVEIFKEISNYGFNFQLSSLAQVIYDPLTKLLIKKFGGIDSVGLYELASKILFQIRQLIVIIINTIVPVIAELKERNSDYVNELYYKIFNFVVLVSIILFTIELLSFPIIADIFIDSRNNNITKFNVYFTEIAIGLTINIFCIPAYMFNLGTGNIRSNTIAFVTGAVMYISLELIIGKIWKDEGVVLGWLIGSSVLSFTIIILFQFKEKIDHKLIFSDKSIHYSLVISAIILLIYCIYSVNNYNKYLQYFLIITYLICSYKIIKKNPIIVSLLIKYKPNFC